MYMVRGAPTPLTQMKKATAAGAWCATTHPRMAESRYGATAMSPTNARFGLILSLVIRGNVTVGLACYGPSSSTNWLKRAVRESPHRVFAVPEHVHLALADAVNGDEGAAPRRRLAHGGDRHPERVGDLGTFHDRDVRFHHGNERPDDQRRQEPRPRGDVVECAEHEAVGVEVDARLFPRLANRGVLEVAVSRDPGVRPDRRRDRSTDPAPLRRA